MYRNRSLLMLLAVCSLALNAGAAPGPARPAAPQAPRAAAENDLQYTIVDLGTLPNPSTNYNQAYAINNSGWVAGTSDDRAFLWHDDNGNGQSDAGEMRDLGGLYYGFANYAWGISQNGWVAGVALAATAPPTSTAFRWHDDNGNGQSDAGEMQDLGTLGGDWSGARDVNDSGWAVGSARDDGNFLAAFLWKNGSMSSLGTLGGPWSGALALNADDWVVGSAATASLATHAFLHRPGIGMQDLGTLGGTESSANDINDSGWIVGSAAVAGGNLHPFLWKEGEGMQDLGTLGGASAVATGINSQGWVVGGGITSGGEGHAFVWHDGVLQDLNDLVPAGSGWILQNATAINDQGQIVGWGWYNNATRAFLLTPGSWTLMFYLDGDNDLDDSYYPIFDNLEQATHQPGVTTLALWDQLGDDNSAYYEVQPGYAPPYTEGENYFPQGELNMGDPNTLLDFVAWAKANYPADHYALILSSHGSGLGGILEDVTDGGDYLTLEELGQTMAAAATDGPLDVLYLDACLMGMVEVAFEMQGSIDYLVASEDIQWGAPEPYFDYVSGVTAASTPAEVAVQFAQSYAGAVGAQNLHYTISAVDMAQLGGLAQAAFDLGHALDDNLPSIAADLTTVVTLVQRFDSEQPQDQINSADSYTDLYHFAELSGLLIDHAGIQAAAQAVQDALADYVLYESHASAEGYLLDNSHGVSIFFPDIASSFYDPSSYQFAAGAVWPGGASRPGPASLAEVEGGWGAMLVNYFAATQPGGPDDPTPPELRARAINYRVFLPLVAK